jgi:hypothetical protein
MVNSELVRQRSNLECLSSFRPISICSQYYVACLSKSPVRCSTMASSELLRQISKQECLSLCLSFHPCQIFAIQAAAYLIKALIGALRESSSIT